MLPHEIICVPELNIEKSMLALYKLLMQNRVGFYFSLFKPKLNKELNTESD